MAATNIAMRSRHVERPGTATGSRCLKTLARPAARLRVDPHSPRTVLVEMHLASHRPGRLALEPQPVQQAPFLRLVPIDEAGAGVQDLVIIDEGGLARPQHHLEANLVTLCHLFETGERLLFELSQRFAQPFGALVDDAAHIAATQDAVLGREYRHAIG